MSSVRTQRRQKFMWQPHRLSHTHSNARWPSIQDSYIPYPFHFSFFIFNLVPCILLMAFCLLLYLLPPRPAIVFLLFRFVLFFSSIHFVFCRNYYAMPCIPERYQKKKKCYAPHGIPLHEQVHLGPWFYPVGKWQFLGHTLTGVFHDSRLPSDSANRPGATAKKKNKVWKKSQNKRLALATDPSSESAKKLKS